MATSGRAGLLSRRSTLAGSVSLALHGGVVLLAVALLGTHAARSPRQIALTSVEIVSPVPLPPRPAAAPVPAMTPARAEASAAPSPAVRSTVRQDRTSPPPRAVSATEVLDLKVSYDTPDNFASKRGDAPSDGEPGGIDGGRGVADDSRRQLQDSLANLQIPVPPPVPRARAARPKHNYHQLRLHSVRRFAGLTIKLLLTIDAHGRVSDVELVEGIDGQVDRRVVELARRFEFEAALDADGAPVPGTSKWDIQIVDDDNGQLRNSLERGYY